MREPIEFKNDRERAIYDEGVLFGLMHDPTVVSDDIITSYEAWLFLEGRAKGEREQE